MNKHDKKIKKHILFVVENNPVPFDTRVWNEVKSIQKIYNNVSVICPKQRNETSHYKIIDNVKIYMYPNLIQGSSAIGLMLEYIIAYFFISIYALFLYVRIQFQIVHLANPPDFLSIIFFPYKLFNIKIIFDNHDLSPEVYMGKFGKKDIIYKILMLLERISYTISDYAITVNESFKSIVVNRYKINDEKITIVRNGPKLGIADEAIKNKKIKIKDHLIGYVGIIDKQDNLEQLVSSIDYIVRKRKYHDFKMLIIGDGTDRKNIENLIKRKGLENYFIFHGAEFNRNNLYQLLHDTEVCVDPQLCTKETKFMTAIKIMEYMAVGKPIVQYNIGEGKYTAGKASLYIENNDETVFADAIIELLGNKRKRDYMGKLGRIRVEKELQWAVQERKLLNLYYRIFRFKN
jgi:glycosyltransferase involved in cell wall biosynthesis